VNFKVPDSMYALLTIGVSLLALVILLRLRVRIGLAMVVAALLLALLLGVTPAEMGHKLASEWRQKSLTQTTPYLFVSLTALLLLVNVIGQAMTQIGISERLVPAMQGLFRSRRVALAAIPLMMGMLPTPGGIMLSAPMVRVAGDDIGIERSRLAAINYWFRHQWEPIWPLFPALPLIQGMLGVSAGRLIAYHLVLTTVGVTAGVVFLLLVGIPPRRPNGRSGTRSVHVHLKDFIHAFWPIAFTAVLYIAFNVPPAVGVLLSIVGLLCLHKVELRRWGGIFKAANEPDMALLIFGALWFKLNLEAGGAVASVVELFTQMHMPPLWVVFLLPFIVSFSTGVTMPTVAIVYPFLQTYIGRGAQTHLEVETLAFAALVFGLAISPIHLCVALSAGYFETPLSRIILKVLPPALCVVAAGFALAMLVS
jgi:integral membrane protein (TIGR00529 family)